MIDQDGSSDHEWQATGVAGWQRHLYRKPGRTKRISEYHGPNGEVLNSRDFAIVEASLKEPAPQPVEIDMPAPSSDKPSKETVKAGLATPEEISYTAQMLLIMVSGLVALFSQLPELAMSQDEAESLAKPLGNILEKSALNRTYGRYLKDGGDYVALGYAVYGYLYRVGSSLQARAQYERDRARVGQGPGDDGRGATQGSAQPFAGTPPPSYQPVNTREGNSAQSNGRRTASGGLAQYAG